MAAEPVMIEKDKLDQMLIDVSNELAEMLKAEQSELAKSAEDDEPGESSEGSQPPTEADGSAEGSPTAEGSAPPPMAAAPPAEASAPPPEASAPAPDQAGGDIAPAPTVEGLQAEYAQLDPESLKMHYLACKSALMAVMGADQQGSAGAPPPEASAPAGGPPPPAAAPPMAPPMMGKSESVSKSLKDPDIEALKKQVADQEVAIGHFVKVMETAMTPVRKSVKNASDMRFIGRTGDESSNEEQPRLTKSQVQTKLSSKISEGKLSKNDKELIYQYNIGKVSVDSIAHLLKDAQ